MAGRGASDDAEQHAAAERVLAAKIALGEAGPAWWDDDAPDVSGLDPAQTSYVDWWHTTADRD